jgi:hypothetical protein
MTKDTIRRPFRSLLIRLDGWFSLDARSLAAARITLGLAILADILVRLTDVEAHYSDIGLVPRAAFLAEVGFPWSFSIYFANGSVAFAAILLSIHAFAATAMALGWHTRLSTVLVAFLTVSLHNRNWFINNGGDDVLRVILLVLMFIPWGETWSVDQWRRGEGAARARRMGGGWVGVWFLQVGIIYFISFLLKNHPIWRTEFTGVYYATHLDIFATEFSRWLRTFPWPLKVGSVVTILLEWLGPLALWGGWGLPRRAWPWLRLLVVAGFWGLHGGIILTMNIGLFPWYCLALWLSFLPSEFWERLFARFPAPEARLRAGLARLAGPPMIVQAAPAPRPWRWLSQAFAAVVFLTILFWNLSTLKQTKIEAKPFMAAARWMHLYQEWNMFAPFPKRENFWIEIPAELEDGSTIELITGDADVLTSKRERFPGAIKNEHWRKLYLNLPEDAKVARFYGGMMCRLWNRDPADGGRRPRLRRFNVELNYHMMMPDYVQGPHVRREAWKHWCFPEDIPATPGAR